MSDVSGTAVLCAPEMQELLRLIESPDIHGVIAKEFSRLMRPENFKDYVPRPLHAGRRHESLSVRISQRPHP
jgi:hypothetical protein